MLTTRPSSGNQDRWAITPWVAGLVPVAMVDMLTVVVVGNGASRRPPSARREHRGCWVVELEVAQPIEQDQDDRGGLGNRRGQTRSASRGAWAAPVSRVFDLGHEVDEARSRCGRDRFRSPPETGRAWPPKQRLKRGRTRPSR